MLPNSIRLPLILFCATSLLLYHSGVDADGGLSTLIAGAVSAGATLTGVTVQSLTESGPNRKVVFEIINQLDVPLYGGSYFLQWGWNKDPPPSVIRPHIREVASFEKVGDTATGTAGILSYKFGNHSDPARIAIIFSVPYNYIHASNWFGLQFIGMHTTLDKDQFNKMYYSNAWENPKVWEVYGYAYEGEPIAVYHNDYIVSASMSNFGRSVIHVNIQKTSGGYEKNNGYFRKIG